MTKPGYKQSPEHVAARFAARGIIPTTQADWKSVAETLAAEVERLRSQVDRMEKLGQPAEEQPPLISPFRDIGHPTWPLHVAMNLDTQEGHDKAWLRVRDGTCGKCGGALEPTRFEGYDGECPDCQLLWFLSPGHFGFETPERAEIWEAGAIREAVA